MSKSTSTQLKKNAVKPKPPVAPPDAAIENASGYNIQFIIKDPALRRRLREMAIVYGEAIGDFRAQGGAVAKAIVEEALFSPEVAAEILEKHAARIRAEKEATVKAK